MARKCYATGKGTAYGNSLSHSLRATRRAWKVNLQKVRIIDEKGRVRRVYVSAHALRAGLVTRA
ncbi:MAG: 50S ribosomal protein L28 [Bacilli bacterium]|jgi:large subunit ribosomal protein L28|nr:50S ribosomal protein L28 [Acholeplasmataceae bacterium]